MKRASADFWALWAMIGALGVHVGAVAQAPAALEVTAKGFKGQEGQALVTVYDSEKAWLEIPKALKTFKQPISNGRVSLKIEDLPPGTYGVSVVHDTNKNGKLDMRWFPFPKPKEGAGASRDPKSKMGPPKWKDAKFEVKAGESRKLVITLQYL